MSIAVANEHDVYSVSYIARSRDVNESTVVRAASRLGLTARRINGELYFDADNAGRLADVLVDTNATEARPPANSRTRGR